MRTEVMAGQDLDSLEPQRDFLRGIELLGTRVLPQIRAELGTP